MPKKPRQRCRRRILVCLDGSPFSEVCLPYGVSLARARGSAVTLLHVVEGGHERLGRQTRDGLGRAIARQEARIYLEQLGAKAKQELGRPVEIRLAQGHPARRIVALAYEIGAELIVLGSGGEAGATAWNLGGTAQQVLKMARGCVVITRSGASAPGVVSSKRGLWPCDASFGPERVLPTLAHTTETGEPVFLVVLAVQALPPSSVLCGVVLS